jgi:hypothetical protein
MKILTSLILSVMLSGTAAAADYGMAGCGLGSIVAQELHWDNNMAQIFVATSNGTAGSQTFGITSGTSNCGAAASPSMRGKVEGQKKAERTVFLHYNLAQVRADAARGDGEYIAGLADLFGCRNQLTGSYGGFATMSQRWHESLFNSNDATVVQANFERALTQDSVACG